MTREEQIFNGFAEMMKGLLGNENLEVPNFETPQDSCEDAIIRHVVKEQMIKYGFNAPDMTVTEFVESLPPITPQTRWIPVSERLPEVMDGTNGERSDDVLICVEDEKCITISTGFYGYYPCSQSEQGWWSVWAHGCEQLDNKCEVLAWMPLPELYKESEG